MLDWAYCFVAYKNNRSRIYSNVSKYAIGTMKFKVPKNKEYLWLLGIGAPTEHWSIPMENKEPKKATTWKSNGLMR